jgi:hypothetical protein
VTHDNVNDLRRLTNKMRGEGQHTIVADHRSGFRCSGLSGTLQESQGRTANMRASAAVTLTARILDESRVDLTVSGTERFPLMPLDFGNPLEEPLR